MNINLKDITKLGPKISTLFEKYKVIIFMFILLLTFGFLVINIGRHSTREPAQSEIDEELKTVQLPKIDEEAVRKILELKDQNIEIESSPNTGRTNPFSEN